MPFNQTTLVPVYFTLYDSAGNIESIFGISYKGRQKPTKEARVFGNHIVFPCPISLNLILHSIATLVNGMYRMFEE